VLLIRLHAGWLLCVAMLLYTLPAMAQAAPPTPPACGLQVAGVKLKDHSLFYHAGFYYLISIRIVLPEPPNGRGEDALLVARSADRCTWEVLGTALTPGAAGTPDESYLWAPHVLRFGETWYLYYTGVNRNIAQSIMLATNPNPTQWDNWTRQPMLFQPNHAGMIYGGADTWSDARDPMVLPYQDRYLLYYTGVDTSGGIIGVADSPHPAGAWRDLGAVLREQPGVIPESPFVLAQAGYYYLVYHIAGTGVGRWHWAISPFGPWQAGGTLAHGWAHDFWRMEDGTWLVSYLVGNGTAIRVEPLNWIIGDPPAPLVGQRVLLPLVVRGTEE
jgi:hypothetical protein